MNSPVLFTCYTLDGTTIAVASNDRGLLETLYQRLAPLASAQQSVCDIVFEFHGVVEPAGHLVVPPSGPTRPVDGVPGAAACYSAKQSQLFVDYAGQVRALCDFTQDRATISYLRSDPESVALATHLVFDFLLGELLKRRWIDGADEARLLVPDCEAVPSLLSHLAE